LRAAERGRRVLLLEKNRRAGIKILMSGGTRCNLTHACDNRGIMAAYGGQQGKFLQPALSAFSVQRTLEMFHAEGLTTKAEDTGKIFPASDKATDVLAALLKRFERSGATLAMDEALTELAPTGDTWRLRTTQRTLASEKVILTTGGKSYPGSGTTGDGYAWAANLGHAIVPPRPALTPISTSDAWVKSLSGVTIPDVALQVIDPALGEGAAPLATRRGSFLFTHFGCSGPVALDVSRAVSGHIKPERLQLVYNFLPSLPRDQLLQQIKQAASSAGKKLLSTILPEQLPQRLYEAILPRHELRLDRKAAELTKFEREQLADAIQRCIICVAGVRGFGQAEVTAGGVSLDEVDPRTMQSRLAPGLYFAGEILDLDGPIGGYNFQAAWSTGWLAGSSV
jgi:predicted Rossmann fold flavoprotein